MLKGTDMIDAPRIKLLLAAGLLLSAGGCGNDNPVSPGGDADLLMTIDFVEPSVEGWTGPRNGYVFASDASGAVLDVQRWEIPQKVELRSRGPRPATMTLTLVRDLGNRVAFDTETLVATGTTRQIPESVWEAPRYVPVEFENAPETSRYVVMTPHHGTIAATGLPDVLRVPVREEGSPGYFLAVAADGTGYAHWIPELRDTLSLDFAGTTDFEPVEGVDIAIPARARSASCALLGWPFEGAESTLRVLDYVWYADTPESLPDHVTVYPPPFDVADLRTRIQTSLVGTPGTWYWLEMPGAPPATIPYLEGDMSVLSARPDSLVVTADFAWDRLACFWRQGTDMDASWTFSAVESGGAAALPEIPAEILADFPSLVPADFRLIWWTLYQDMPDGGVTAQGRSVVDGVQAVPADIGNLGADPQLSQSP